MTKTMPHSLEAEMALLGSVLFDNEAYAQIEVGLEPRHFFEPLHSRVWDYIRTSLDKGQRVEPIAMGEHFVKDPAYEGMGGLRYFAELIDRAPPSSSANRQAQTIMETALRRGLVEVANIIHELAPDGSVDAHEAASIAEDQIKQVAAGFAPSLANVSNSREAGDTFVAKLEEEKRSGKSRGWMTGLRCVDYRMRGLHPGHLIVIGGRPSMGKTALARCIMYGAAERNPGTQFAFECVEMDRDEMSSRSLSFLSARHAGESIAYQDMDGAAMSAEQIQRLADLNWRLPENFILEDASILTVGHVRERVRQLKRQGPLGAICIDYLQIMQKPPSNGRNDAAVLGDITMALKNMAGQERVAVVLLSQLSRNIESRDDKRPTLSDLRESGAIEQDANAVLFPYRPAYYLERSEPEDTESPEHTTWAEDVERVRYKMMVGCAKWRGGKIGTDEQYYDPAYDWVRDTDWVRED